MNTSQWQRSLLLNDSVKDFANTSRSKTLRLHYANKSSNITKKLWQKTLRENEICFMENANLKREKAEFRDRIMLLNKSKSALLFELSEAKSKVHSQNYYINRLRSILEKQRAAMAETQELINLAQSAPISANSSCMSLQSEEIDISNAESRQDTTAAEESQLEPEEPIVSEAEDIEDTDKDDEEVEDSDEEGFDIGDYQMRKSLATHRKSVAPEKRRKTQRMTRAPRKRSSILVNQETEDPTEQTTQPKRKSIRRTLNRRTVNFNFGLDESINVEQPVAQVEGDSNKENEMKTPMKEKQPSEEPPAGTRSSRRNRKQVSYKEIPDNAKLRRGDPISSRSLVTSFSPKTKKSKTNKRPT